jgi:hypothetical protein
LGNLLATGRLQYLASWAKKCERKEMYNDAPMLLLFPIGNKYKGQPLQNIKHDVGYMKWFIENVSKCSERYIILFWFEKWLEMFNNNKNDKS